MSWTIIDKLTGEYPTKEAIEQIAKDNDLDCNSWELSICSDGKVYLTDKTLKMRQIDRFEYKG